MYLRLKNAFGHLQVAARVHYEDDIMNCSEDALEANFEARMDQSEANEYRENQDPIPMQNLLQKLTTIEAKSE